MAITALRAARVEFSVNILEVSAVISLITAALSQQSVEDFYRGKKIDLIIGYSSGGTYDLYARLDQGALVDLVERA